MKMLNILTVYKFVETERDTSLTVMMEIRKIMMVVIKIAKFKKDGIVKVDLVLKQVLVYHILLLDHLFH
jgi:hypothetical protein